MKEFLKHTHIFIIEMLLAILIKLSSYKYMNGEEIQDTIFIIASVIIIAIYVIQCVNIFYPKITEWLNKNNSNNNQ